MVNKLKRLLENRMQPGLVTPSLDRWLLSNDGIPMSPELAERFVGLMSAPSPDRSGVFHPSSAHLCRRRQQFSFLGVEGIHHFDSSLQNKFNNGQWVHLRWQAMLMTAGILDDIEVVVEVKGLKLRGSMDGIGSSESRGKFGFELKGWSALVDEPKPAHIEQIHAYMFASGLDLFSLVYEHKSSQDWREFVVERDQEIIDRIEATLWELNEFTDRQELIPPLKECRRERGDTFKRCPYRNMCLEVSEWGEVTDGEDI